MADFFEDLGKRISEVASDIGKATEDTIEIQRLRSDIRSLKRNNERDYIHIGKAVCEKFQNHEVLDMDLIPLCEAVEQRLEDIENVERNISSIKEDK